jgi:hypothetical protein
MTKQIDILLPGGTVSYTEGVADVQSINVHFYFANVVHIVIFLTDLTQIHYYQVPCVYTTTP